MPASSSGRLNKKTGRRIRNSLNRAEILAAAFVILERDGVPGLTVRAIAAHCQCSVSALYSHFRNFEEIVAGMVRFKEIELAAELRDALKRRRKLMERLRSLSYAYWDFSLRNREFQNLLYATQEARARNRTEARLPPAYRVYAECFHAARRSGELGGSREEANELARTFFAWLYGWVMLELTGMLRPARGGAHPLEAGLQRMVRMLDLR